MNSAVAKAELLLALEAIKSNPELSVREAAKIYNVPRTTLHRRMKNISLRRDYMAKSRRLTNEEEHIIIQHILDLDSRLFPPRLSNVEEMANRLLADRDEPTVSSRWASNFVARHQALRGRFTRRGYQKNQPEDPNDIADWFQLVRHTIAAYGIQEEDIYNFDETGFMLGMISTTPVTGSERSGKPITGYPGNREWVSVVQGINSQGWSIPPFIIVAGQNHLANWYEDSMLPSDWVIATTHKGWATNKKGVEWIQHFEKNTKAQSCGVYRLLIMNGHHHSTEFELFCKKQKIITLCIPANSSHTLHPLSIGCFGSLKKAYWREVQEVMKARTSHLSKTEFLFAFLSAFQAAMTEKNIKEGFRGAGIVPFDPDSVLWRLDVKLRRPSPVEGGVELPKHWVPRSLKKPTGATSQTNSITRQISHPQGSSPPSILLAVDQIAKEAHGMIHEMASLECKNEQLRAAHARLSKRRNARITRLHHSCSMTGGMTIAQEQSPEAEQIQHEIHRRRGQTQRNEMQRCGCGACGKSCHNAHARQIIIEISDEEDGDKE